MRTVVVLGVGLACLLLVAPDAAPWLAVPLGALIGVRLLRLPPGVLVVGCIISIILLISTFSGEAARPVLDSPRYQVGIVQLEPDAGQVRAFVFLMAGLGVILTPWRKVGPVAVIGLSALGGVLSVLIRILSVLIRVLISGIGTIITLTGVFIGMVVKAISRAPAVIAMWMVAWWYLYFALRARYRHLRHRCHRCNDHLPPGAAYCIACKAPTPETEAKMLVENQQKGKVAAIGRTHRLLVR